MTSYFSTFIPGLGDFIQEQLVKDLSKTKIALLLDGLVVYQTESTIKQVQCLGYLNNSFVLINRFFDLTAQQPIETMVKQCLSDTLVLPPVTGKTFRVVFSSANTPVSLNTKLHRQVEDTLVKSAMQIGYKLEIDRTTPDIEYWFVYREEGFGFFGQRITKHPDYKKLLAPGQLRPELAAILCLLSNPDKADIVLDPCAGSGAIAIERTKFSSKQIIGGDIDRDKVTKLKTIPGLEATLLDATNMTQIQTGSITKIITDPPWGIYQPVHSDFFPKIFAEFARVLTSGGLAIILLGRNIDLPKGNDLAIIKRFNILVSGKKATIRVLQKT